MSKPDYYAVLGVSKDADAETIKKAYRKKARICHPDVGGSEDEFKAINEAYEVLSDPEKKKVYDQFGSTNPASYSGGAAGAYPGGSYDVNVDFDWEEILNAMRNPAVGDMFGFDLGDIFGFGRGTKTSAASSGFGGTGTSVGGLDVRAATTLPLSDMLRGTKCRLTVNVDGKNKTLDVKVPSASGLSKTLKFSGQGKKSGGKKGDLYIEFTADVPDNVKIDGKNLIYDFDLDFITAVKGGKVTVKLLDGRTIKLNIPPMTQTGKKFSVKGGLDEHGRTFLTARIVLPHLTDKQKKTIKEM